MPLKISLVQYQKYFKLSREEKAVSYYDQNLGQNQKKQHIQTLKKSESIIKGSFLPALTSLSPLKE